MKRYKILLFEEPFEKGMEILEKNKDKVEFKLVESFNEDYLLNEVKDVDAIIIRVKGKITRNLIKHASKLKVIGRPGVGVNNIDVKAATDYNVKVVNAPDANYESVAEMTITLMLAIAKKSRRADAAVRNVDWDDRYNCIGVELLGKTLGVVGFGRIGRRVAEIANLAFHMSILYYDIVKYESFENKYNARKTSIEEILQNSDFVSIHMPYFPEVHHLIGEKEINMMKKRAFLINTSRGPLWDEEALYNALKDSKIAGAATDVFEEEPPKEGTKLRELDNVILSPHTAAFTKEALDRMGMVVEDVIAVLEDKTPKHQVN